MTLDLASPYLLAAEVEIYQPAGNTVAMAQGWGTRPRGALAQLPEVLATSGTILASDGGYRTRESDAGGLAVYPALLDPGISIDRRIGLNPASPESSFSIGAISLLNPDGRWDAIAATQNCDGRNARILVGSRIWDAARQIYIDPPYASLTPIWAGVATPWLCDDSALQIPVRDAGYWADRPLQTAVYGGSGALDGSSDIAGSPIPKVRGGPISNVTPVLVDPVAGIYQWSDAPGTITAIYEGGLGGGITYAGDTGDLYAGTTPAGQYRTNNARSLFQLGSPPARAITIDCTGDFPVFGAVADAIGLALHVLLEDSGLPAGLIDTGSFATAAAAYPYAAGFSSGQSQATGMQMALSLLGSLGAKLVPSRTGHLRVMVLRALPSGTAAAATYGIGQAISVTPVGLGSPLDPPAAYWRVGVQRNWTVTTSDLNPTVDGARKSFLSAEYRYRSASSPAVLAAYRKPSNPDPIASLLLNPDHAEEVANDLVDLWSVRRRLYAVVLPVVIGIRHDIGDVLRLVWPMDDLRGGQLGQIVGEQIRLGDGTITFLVLV